MRLGVPAGIWKRRGYYTVASGRRVHGCGPPWKLRGRYSSLEQGPSFRLQMYADRLAVQNHQNVSWDVSLVRLELNGRADPPQRKYHTTQ